MPNRAADPPFQIERRHAVAFRDIELEGAVAVAEVQHRTLLDPGDFAAKLGLDGRHDALDRLSSVVTVAVADRLLGAFVDDVHKALIEPEKLVRLVEMDIRSELN